MTETFKQLSREMLPAIEAEMRAVLRSDRHQTPNTFYGMMHYHMGWVNSKLDPADVNGGKRIRPLLCLLTCAAAGGDWQQAVPAAAAIELLHNFTLIHDDIEDASPTRRGRDTVWQIWGIELAINSGDAMFALAHLALNRLTERGVAAETVVKALRRFDETCVRLTEGQHADMTFERQDNVTVAQYVEMITGKTAVLLSLCADLGAEIAGADADTVAHYRQFGLELGLAFQVIDDILGIWGNEMLTGKSTATDIVTRKKTMPVLYGLEKSQALQALYTQPKADPGTNFVNQVVDLLNENGAYDFATEKAVAYSQSALAHLQAANPTGEAGQAMRELADMLLRRDY